MIKKPQLSMFDLVSCLSNIIDLVSPAVVNHHSRVAYISFKLGEELGLPHPKQTQLAIAGLLQDIGALSLKERLESLKLDFSNSDRHAERGYYFLNIFDPLADVAKRIRYHHMPWNYGEGMASNGEAIPFSSNILNLAVRIAVLIDRSKPILSQV